MDKKGKKQKSEDEKECKNKVENRGNENVERKGMAWRKRETEDTDKKNDKAVKEEEKKEKRKQIVK